MNQSNQYGKKTIMDKTQQNFGFKTPLGSGLIKKPLLKLCSRIPAIPP